VTREDDLRRLVDFASFEDTASLAGETPPAVLPFSWYFHDPELEQAKRTLAPWGGDVRAALKATHPDTPGGDHELFLKVMKARDTLRLRDAV
jgi:hypothetical protein